MVQVTAIYAGLLALLFLWLSLRVVGARRTHKVSVGDGGERAVLKAMRAQANCAEYAPIGIILLALAELQGLPALAMHLLGAALLAGRVLHGWGYGRTPQVVHARVWGMYLTVGSIFTAAILNLWCGLFWN